MTQVKLGMSSVHCPKCGTKCELWQEQLWTLNPHRYSKTGNRMTKYRVCPKCNWTDGK